MEHSIDTLIETILFSKSNILHPSILTPEGLVNELIKTTQYLSPSVSYSTRLEVSNGVHLLKTATISAYYADKKLIFIISNLQPLQISTFTNVSKQSRLRFYHAD